MDTFFVKPDEIIELIKKRYENKENNGEEINLDEISSEELDNFVIKSETERFNDLFNRVFGEEILPQNEKYNQDSEDGPINLICLEIITKIKNSIEKIDKTKLLNFLFKLIKELLLNKKEED